MLSRNGFSDGLSLVWWPISLIVSWPTVSMDYIELWQLWWWSIITWMAHQQTSTFLLYWFLLMERFDNSSGYWWLIIHHIIGLFILSYYFSYPWVWFLWSSIKHIKNTNSCYKTCNYPSLKMEHVISWFGTSIITKVNWFLFFFRLGRGFYLYSRWNLLLR